MRSESEGEINGLAARVSCRILTARGEGWATARRECDYVCRLDADSTFGRGFNSRRLHQYNYFVFKYLQTVPKYCTVFVPPIRRTLERYRFWAFSYIPATHLIALTNLTGSGNAAVVPSGFVEP